MRSSYSHLGGGHNGDPLRGTPSAWDPPWGGLRGGRRGTERVNLGLSPPKNGFKGPQMDVLGGGGFPKKWFQGTPNGRCGGGGFPKKLVLRDPKKGSL